MATSTLMPHQIRTFVRLCVLLLVSDAIITVHLEPVRVDDQPAESGLDEELKEVCQPRFGEPLPVPDSGRLLREGARGGQAERARGRTDQPGIAEQLEGLLTAPEEPGGSISDDHAGLRKAIGEVFTAVRLHGSLAMFTFCAMR